jgi:hypothetical protein
MPVAERTEERRRTPRVPTADSLLCVPSTANALLLDVSRGGVLLSSPCHIEPGHRAWLEIRLGEVAVRLELEVRRASPEEPSSRGPFHLGAKLLPLDEATAAAVERFLGRAEP